ncbi:MAG TPA: tetratricopeptide repeat protein, partial [Pyrinomonadaceae bacterium]|nr:tetratricopeptide repeat protein [Pyrinomonadaceae bacterium]
MSNPPNKLIYRFEGVEVDPSQGCLRRLGQEQRLRQQTFQVLLYLLEQRERLVTKEEIFEKVWQGTAVTDNALVQSIREIRTILEDDPRHPRFIETVPKAGYRFIVPVEEHPTNGIATIETEEITSIKIELKQDSGDNEIAERRPEVTNKFLTGRLFSPRHLIFAVIILAFAVIAIAFIQLGEIRRANQPIPETALPQLPGKKTLAVMFFENQSETEELDWLRQGLADMLITNLSRSEKLTVLSRPQLQLLLERTGYKTGDAVGLEKALEIARKSGAEVFIVGSFARLGEKMRLDLQLHNTETGGLEIAESLTVDRPEQIFTEIDLLSFKLANHFGAEQQENRVNLASAMTNNLEAYRYYSLALEKAGGLHKKDAVELLEKAIVLDPEFAMAHARIGYVYAVTWGWAEKAKPHLERAFQLSDRLTEKDRLYIAAWYATANLDYPSAIPPLREIIQKYPLESEAYLRLGYLLRGEEKFDEAISVMRQGLTIDPESPALYNSLGLLYSLLGRHDEAIAAHLRYVALAPNEPNSHDSLGMSYQWAGRYEEAIAAYNRSLELNPNFDIAYVHLGVAHFQTGRYRTAIEWFNKYIAVAPSKLESARGYGYISQVHRKMKNYEAAAALAKKAFEEHSRKG